jgi:hypothetical protein
MDEECFQKDDNIVAGPEHGRGGVHPGGRANGDKPEGRLGGRGHCQLPPPPLRPIHHPHRTVERLLM